MKKLVQCRDCLARQGYRPEVHDDHLTFRNEGGSYLVPADEADPACVIVVASIELLLPSADAFETVLPRALQTLQVAARRFCECMQASLAFEGELDELGGGGDERFGGSPRFRGEPS